MEIPEIIQAAQAHLEEEGLSYSDEEIQAARTQTIEIGKLWAALVLSGDFSDSEIVAVFDDYLRKMCLIALGYNSVEEYQVDYFLHEMFHGEGYPGEGDSND